MTLIIVLKKVLQNKGLTKRPYSGELVQVNNKNLQRVIKLSFDTQIACLASDA